MARSDKISETGAGGSAAAAWTRSASRAVAGKASGAKSGMTSTGKAKVNAAESKMYNEPVKGSGKPKYQNVIKEARTNTKKSETQVQKNISKITGKKVSDTTAKRKADAKPNTAKQIDREYKVQKGVRTEKPSTPKVPVKKKGK